MPAIGPKGCLALYTLFKDFLKSIFSFSVKYAQDPYRKKRVGALGDVVVNKSSQVRLSVIVCRRQVVGTA